MNAVLRASTPAMILYFDSLHLMFRIGLRDKGPFCTHVINSVKEQLQTEHLKWELKWQSYNRPSIASLWHDSARVLPGISWDKKLKATSVYAQIRQRHNSGQYFKIKSLSMFHVHKSYWLTENLSFYLQRFKSGYKKNHGSKLFL